MSAAASLSSHVRVKGVAALTSSAAPGGGARRELLSSLKTDRLQLSLDHFTVPQIVLKMCKNTYQRDCLFFLTFHSEQNGF